MTTLVCVGFYSLLIALVMLQRFWTLLFMPNHKYKRFQEYARNGDPNGFYTKTGMSWSKDGKIITTHRLNKNAHREMGFWISEEDDY